jgi:hypothetical protein
MKSERALVLCGSQNIRLVGSAALVPASVSAMQSNLQETMIGPQDSKERLKRKKKKKKKKDLRIKPC